MSTGARIDLAKVADLVREVAAIEILPRFRNLQEGDTRQKSPGDFVTIADESAELALTPRLLDLLPGSVVVGEEATAKNPAVMDALAGQAPVWLVDPIDGTGNFAGGDEGFVSMLALVQADDILASWIYRPVTGEMVVAEQGAGVTIDGRKAPPFVPTSAPKGVLAYGKRGAPGIAEQVDKRRDRLSQLKSARAAGIDYVRMAKGEIDFTFFSGIMPWDHAPGAMIIRELGGHIAYIRGDETYRPSHALSAAGILSATSHATWRNVHETLFGEG
ncbi:inositol monophosphatase family protein [Dongia rigui]|uniref:Inositol monophosphatase family protein n=1 Tax=Dongia rigui TaxID=940149 RepID=A0ABU5E595_9PROT|nr:inositol monophosphatase family protein [Dongia rigui]MDY0874237.1 inositol monophosphatase family protein [Dongia rigui]